MMRIHRAELHAGNPGCVDFYYDFLKRLHACSEGKLQCLAVGHVGHSIRSGDHANERLFNLQEQIQHKRTVLEDILA
jgi:hypothetical protein